MSTADLATMPHGVMVYDRPDRGQMDRAGAAFLVALLAFAALMTAAFLGRYD